MIAQRQVLGEKAHADQEAKPQIGTMSTDLAIIAQRQVLGEKAHADQEAKSQIGVLSEDISMIPQRQIVGEKDQESKYTTLIKQINF